MAGNSVVRTDGSRFSRADQFLHKIETFMIIISGLAIAGLVVLAVLSVSGRLIFGQPLSGYIDWIQQFMPAIAFAGISYALRNGTHIRMDMLISRVHGRSYYFVELISSILVLILTLLLIWGSWAHFDRSFDLSQPLFSRDSSIDIGLPVWPSKLLIPISFGLMFLRATLQVITYSYALISNPKDAIGVPIIQDINQQAEAEAAQLMGKD